MVLGHIRIMLFRLMTVNAGDIGIGMPAVRPVRVNAGMLRSLRNSFSLAMSSLASVGRLPDEPGIFPGFLEFAP
jgi:hypothetical protein